MKRERARRNDPAALENAAVAAAAEEELRRIRSENAELRRMIAAAEAATAATAAQSRAASSIPPPPPPPATPPPPTKAASDVRVAMSTFPEGDERKAESTSEAAVKKPYEEPKVIVPTPEPEPVDDTIIREWNAEVDELTAEYQRASEGLYKISSRRTLSLPIDQRGCPVPFSGWLSDPARVVGLVYPPKNITKRGDQIYAIELVQMSFFGMNFVPIYELHIMWHNNKLLAKSGTVKLRQEPGLPDWAREMELNMRMVCETEIEPTAVDGEVVDEVTVQAFAELEIAADIPGVLRAMPGSQGIGNAILDTILLAIEVIAKSQLQSTYKEWARTFPPGSGANSSL